MNQGHIMRRRICLRDSVPKSILSANAIKTRIVESGEDRVLETESKNIVAFLKLQSHARKDRGVTKDNIPAQKRSLGKAQQVNPLSAAFTLF